jgi:hypothetical protein
LDRRTVMAKAACVREGRIGPPKSEEAERILKGGYVL